MEVLSEHLCQGWLEGYLLTGRHGLFNCYEAFIHIVDSMFNQHAKWLKVTREIPWRRPIASLNYLLSSHVWRQDHNGFSHQDPGFIDHVVNKKAEVIRVYLPPDANTLLSVADHCLRSRNYVNVIVAGKQPALELPLDGRGDPPLHARRSASGSGPRTTTGGEPDVVLGCCGDVPTLETLAAAAILREHLPDLQGPRRQRRRPHAPAARERAPARPVRRASSTRSSRRDRPIIFAYHGYPWLIHRLTYRRTNHANLHVRGYKEEGTTTTPFDMVMLNDLDRFHLVMDVIDRVPGPRRRAPRTSGRRWSTAGSRPAPGRASTARTTRRSATGPGRSERASRPRRQRRLDEPQAPPRRRRTSSVERGRRRSTAVAGGRSTPSATASSTAARASASRCVIDDEVDAAHRRADALAPLHNAPALAAHRGGARRRCPDVPHVAVFDTAFHATHPGRGRDLRRPARAGARSGAIRRYGFHGLSVAVGAPSGCRTRVASSSATSAAAARSPPCSTAARSTRRWASRPLEGCPWRRARARRSRCDPLRRSASDGLAPAEVDDALEHESGLDALGGLDDPLGFAVFTYRVAQAVAAMAVALGGLDVIAFSGGVGENREDVRDAVAERVRFLGTFRVDVVTPREDVQIARAVRQLLA